MNYGFVIDNRKCIGCHACSTACKSENQVPLGVNRTWVKYTEQGRYPDVTRHFQVTRCNHCANPPCVRICPVTAMRQRPDGIVEFDGDECIGCKACMQACPYDAIYIDPETGTAAKCHYCAHRVETGLEPACVVVCPEHAIVAGDMDDPLSEITRVLASNPVTVRKPEQGTAPKLFYIEGSDVSMHPTSTQREPIAMQSTEVLGRRGDRRPAYPEAVHELRLDLGGEGPAIRLDQAQGLPYGGPIQAGGNMAEHMVQVGYNAQHKLPWHWPVPAYLVTKGIGAGVPLLMALGVLGLFPLQAATVVWGGLVALVAMGLTTALLVLDLDRPERFLRILFRPQWRSWLTRGAFILVGFSNGLLLWWGLEAATWMGWMEAVPGRLIFAAFCVPFALGAAVYTAFLFAQAEGRDLWQSTLLSVHLAVQALMLGAGVLALLEPGHALFVPLFGVAVLVDLVMMGSELLTPHASEIAARAAHEITAGRYRAFWWGSIVLHLVAVGLLFAGHLALTALAVGMVIVGLYLYEHAFVMAPQEVPNS